MKTSTLFSRRSKLSMLAAASIMAMASSVMAQVAKEPYTEYEGPLEFIPDGLSQTIAGKGIYNAAAGNLQTMAPSVSLSFKGVSQFDLRNLLGGSFIPPDTHGAVGASQFMETTNGVYAIYSKTTGTLQSMMRADAFWANAGATGGLNGDARIMYDAPSQKWIALQFGASVADIQIAVSATSNALGAWNSTKFTGFAGGTADYPTLAIDSKGVYIGTNNFNSSGNFSGTTLNVIARNDLLGAGAPTAANVKQFATPYVSGSLNNVDRGYAIQGVNSTGAVSGRVMAASLFQNDSIRYDVNNPGTAGATLGGLTYLGLTDYTNTLREPGAQPDGTRNIDSFDERIGASVWEMNGKIYAVYAATPVGGGNSEVRFVVTNATTNAVIQEGTIKDPNFDFYQGSLTVNSKGQVVIAYNRSGFSAADGKVSFMARTYDTNGAGQLVQTNELLLHVSDVGNYHNGSVEGAAASGRQRWGDYSAVTLDPNDESTFWAIGEYAAPWNNANGCDPITTPGCNRTGGSTWGTWISAINVAAPVPEPETYAMMLAGLAAMGFMVRRKTKATV